MFISDAMITGRGFGYPDKVNRFPEIGFFDSLGIKESIKIPALMDKLYFWYEGYISGLDIDYHKGNISSDEIEGLAQEHFKSIVTPDGFIKYGNVYIHELENGLICFQDSYNKLLYHPSGIILSGDVHIPFFDKDVIHFDRNSNIFTFHVTCDSKIGEREYHFEDDMYMKRPVVGGHPCFGDFPLNADGANPDMWMFCDGKFLFEKNIDDHYSHMYEDYCYTGTSKSKDQLRRLVTDVITNGYLRIGDNYLGNPPKNGIFDDIDNSFINFCKEYGLINGNSQFDVDWNKVLYNGEERIIDIYNKKVSDNEKNMEKIVDFNIDDYKLPYDDSYEEETSSRRIG